jgi:hypothetical protein
VIVESGLSTNKTAAADCLTGALCDDQRPPNAYARWRVTGHKRSAAIETPSQHKFEIFIAFPVSLCTPDRPRARPFGTKRLAL